MTEKCNIDGCTGKDGLAMREDEQHRKDSCTVKDETCKQILLDVCSGTYGIGMMSNTTKMGVPARLGGP
jgi:hypothetical protein